MRKQIMISLRIFVVLSLLTGLVYPLLVTGIAQLAFPAKANGSLVYRNGVVAGSELIGQAFDSAAYFQSRPSATGYNTLPSGGSNYGLTNSKLKKLVDERRRNFIAFNQLDSLTAIPSEMLFASASGLDPHISKKAALLQVKRISVNRHFTEKQTMLLQKSIDSLAEFSSILGPSTERVNVLLLNLAIDKIK